MKKIKYPLLVRIAIGIKKRLPFTAPFISLLKVLFGNKLTKCIIAIAFPIIFFLEGKSVSIITTKEIGMFVITGLLFAVLNAFVLAVEDYSKINIYRSNCYASILNKISIMENDIASEIIHQNRNINHEQNFVGSNIYGMLRVVDNNSIIDRIAYIICKSIFEWLKEVTDETCFRVGVFQRFKCSSGEFVDLVASEYGDNGTPNANRIYLYTSGKKYYYRALFENNVNDISVLATKKEITDRFFPEEEDYQNSSQHITIPIKINTRTTFLVTIASDKKDVFGKNKIEIKNSFKLLLPLVNMIVPFCYEDKMMKELCENVIVHRASRARRGKDGSFWN
ncbi:MAG: hypothetical protein N2376_00605 [Clostridia bacterium]|nr:hypothetical protein [Clostridia bacterium]